MVTWNHLPRSTFVGMNLGGKFIMNPSFSDVLVDALSDSDNLAKTLAEGFEVSESLVRRWAVGLSVPSPLTQDRVRKFLKMRG